MNPQHLESRSWPAPQLRVGDADRQRVIDELQQHYVEGRLDSEELSERVQQALGARTFGELRPLLSDLPPLASFEPQAPVPPWYTRLDPVLMTFLAMVAALVVVWLLWLPGNMHSAGFLPALFFGGFFFMGPRRRRRP